MLVTHYWGKAYVRPWVILVSFLAGAVAGAGFLLFSLLAS